MDYAKGYFDSAEFRKLYKKYEQMKSEGICSYFETDELSDILSYYLYIGKMNEAEEVYRYAKRLHTENSEITKMEVKILLSFGKAEEALQLIETLNTENDDDALLLKAEVLLAMKEFKASRSIARNILKREEPYNEVAYDALEILLDCGFAEEVLQIAEQALQARPSHRGLLEIKAESLIELQRIDEAIEVYNILLDETPFSTFYWEQLGHIYYLIERYGKSLECFEYELTINEDIEYAKMMQGYCYYHLHDYKRAKEIFEIFRQKYPDNLIIKFYIALSETATGNLKEAHTEYTGIIEYGTKQSCIERMLACINKSILYSMDKEDNKKCMETLQLALSMYPECDIRQLILNKKGFYELRDKENSTFVDMNILDTKEWQNHEALFACGRMFADRCRYEMAIPMLQAAAKEAKEKDSAEIHAYLAYSFFKQNNREKLSLAVDEALKGKSNKLFELFEIPYDANMLPDVFLRICFKKR
ncbi:MAG: tetratricopeptide repeat protein [Bacteroidaceae bacterium]|nr:tetratricopeptide repeat protein [Bacteroidaceae bacterium]